LLALAAVAGTAWQGWQQRQALHEQQTWQQQLDSSQAQLAALLAAQAQLGTRLEQLPSAAQWREREQLLASLQGEQQQQTARLDALFGKSREDWRLAEAEHLLRLAALRLSALQDINSAEALLQAADQILHQQDDPAAFASRQQLARDLETLRTLQRPDRTGLFLRLAALRQQAEQLTPLQPLAEGQGGVLLDLAEQEAPDSPFKAWLQTLSGYFRIQGLQQVRLALSLALEQAQWAALHGYSAVYRQALGQAEEILAAHFNAEDPAAAGLRQRLGELADLPVEVQVPDLSDSLATLQAYLARRAGWREAPAAEEQP
jgi:uroporphyrin-3 C-methyltransferase